MVIEIQNLSENFDDELEEIMIQQGMIEDEMVYADHNIASIPFTSQKEEIEFVKNNCILFKDDTYYYVVCQESIIAEKTGHGFMGEDFTVQRCKIKKYEYFEGI